MTLTLLPTNLQSRCSLTHPNLQSLGQKLRLVGTYNPNVYSIANMNRNECIIQHQQTLYQILLVEDSSIANDYSQILCPRTYPIPQYLGQKLTLHRTLHPTL